ncbi:MAG: hypothetical protein HY904_14855 [Deltaproteobacteria bacterium]|nr:hypothetical protein [Deltaproteobacteria bacterium]
MRRLLLALLSCTALLGGCRDDFGSLSRAPRRGELTPAALSFGPLHPGETATLYARLRNDGEGALHASVTVDPAHGPFIVPPRVVADSSGTELAVRFLAFEAGTYDGLLLVQTDGEENGPLIITLHAVVEDLPSCDDGNPCTMDLPAPSGCEHHPVAAACDDGDPCTVADHCAAGSCTGEALDCNDDIACTVDSCDGTLGCLHEPRAESCDDGNPCTADACLPAVGCRLATAPNGTLCGAPACDAMPLCVDGECSATRAPEGFPCEDGDPCTLGDTCHSGECVKGLGSPMGIGDPVVVATSALADDGMHHPVELLGVLPLGDGRVRVAWMEHVDGPAPEGCFPAGSPPAPRRWLRHAVVDDTGGRTETTEIPLPADGLDPEAARGVATDNGLVILARYQVTPACCEPSAPCGAALPAPQQAWFLLRIAPDGGAADPVELARAPVEPAVGPPGLLPLALAHDHGRLLAVTSQAWSQRCLGACPDSVELTARVLDVSSWPPAQTAQGSFQQEVQGGAERALLELDNLEAALAAGEALVVWRAAAFNGMPACGTVGGGAWWFARTWKAPVDDLASGTLDAMVSAQYSAAAVTVAAGMLGPAVFLAQQQALPCNAVDGGAGCETVCTVHDRVTVRQGDDTTTVEEAERPNGTGAVDALAAGTAFGRALGVIFHDDGTAHVVSPALGPTPALEATWTPPVQVPLRMLRGSHGALVADRNAAWLGAVLSLSLPLVETRVVAVVPAGCGRQPTGNILGLGGMDAGLPQDAGSVDAGSVDAGGVDAGTVDSGSVDGGNVDAGGITVQSADGGMADAGDAG